MFKKITLLLFITLISCDSSERFSSFADEELVDILFDVSLANTMAENYEADIRDSLRNHYLEQISAIHKMDRTMIDSIIDYVHLDNKRFIGISDSLDIKLKRKLDTFK